MNRDEVLRRAGDARGKPAALGADLDLGAFPVPAARRAEAEAAALERQVREAALGAGVDLAADRRAGTLLQVDQAVLATRVGGVAIRPAAG